MAYSSQPDAPLDHMWRKQSKLEKRLKENWQRPQGMRLRTFDNLRQRIWALEGRRDDAFALYAARLLKLDILC